ncbi:SusC/RagA family TonB-linked outer membrane protein (plasmid) [Fulvitalea axinellae]|uniref:SusC/RagA family TonB-linked outer membrane protein n=1 Tax=Fulvitalea axinellae TaxID=1182444 RepID=A0AAU9CXR4_9BACT|nr:SusC/RagA family TonB-linked outer membrane protein [Fulvitalea axinellae]
MKKTNTAFRRQCIFLCLWLTAFFSVSTAYAKTTDQWISSIEGKRLAIGELFTLIERHSEYRVLYTEGDIDLKESVVFPKNINTVPGLLRSAFIGYPEIKYKIIDKQIVVKKTAVPQEKEKTVKGQIKDKKGEPIIGANVVIKGTTRGGITDLDGRFSVKASIGETLVISFIGFKNQEITVDNRSDYQILLQEDFSELDEVVVVGYSSKKVKDLTGSVAKVSAEDISVRNVTNMSNALQGAVSGVRVSRDSGAPGSSSNIQIRGITTIKASGSPLVIVDGIPVESIDLVNPEDIESYSVLKDGAAAAIYGSRAAAGVILLTTKSGKTGELNMEYGYSINIQEPTDKFEWVAPDRYMKMRNELFWNDNGNGTDEYPQYSKEEIDNLYENNRQNPDLYPITNWEDLMFKKRQTAHRHNFSLSGGTDKIKSRASFGYESSDALWDKYTWNRYTVRLKNSLNINDYWEATVDGSYRMSETEQPLFNPLGSGRAEPLYPAIWADGRYATGRNLGNQYAALHLGGKGESRTTDMQGKLGLTFKPIKGLRLSANYSPNYKYAHSKSFRNKVLLYGPDDHDETGDPAGYMYDFHIARLSQSNTTKETHVFQTLANYNLDLGDHGITALAGYETYYEKYEREGMKAEGFDQNDFHYLDKAPVDKVFTNGLLTYEYATRSFFGELNYSYKGKYLLRANVRRDGSSRFHPDHRWGTFKGLSAGWVISDESFMSPLSKHVSFLKLRASYAELGNERVVKRNSNNQLIDKSFYLYSTVTDIGEAYFSDPTGKVFVEPTAIVGSLVSPDISWETTQSTNFALDMGMFDNRLGVTGEYYIKKTRDMLFTRGTPLLLGYGAPEDNVGLVETKGWDLDLTWKDQIGELRYIVAFNLSNSFTVVNDLEDPYLDHGQQRSLLGEEYRRWFGYKSDGIYQTQEEVTNGPEMVNKNTSAGDIRYKDISGPEGVPDGKIDAHDRTYLGSSAQKFLYGGSVRMDYKGFDFSLIFQGVGKQRRRISSKPINGLGEGRLVPSTLYADNYWSHYNTPEQNLSADYPRLTSNKQNDNYRISDFWLFDGSYMRVKNITLGYTIPEKLFNGWGIDKVRVYISGNDIFTIDNYPDGNDPEHNFDKYFITKSYIAGLKVNF